MNKKNESNGKPEERKPAEVKPEEKKSAESGKEPETVKGLKIVIESLKRHHKLSEESPEVMALRELIKKQK